MLKNLSLSTLADMRRAFAEAVKYASCSSSRVKFNDKLVNLVTLKVKFSNTR